MLKQVMLGSGGILLAAAIFASSVTPGPSAAPATPVQAAPVAPPTLAPPGTTSRTVTAPPVFPDDSGDIKFGAPMIEALPMEAGHADPMPLPAQPLESDAGGGLQIKAQPGRALPIPQ